MTPTPANTQQRIQVLCLHAVALSLLALQFYVRRLPDTSDAIPKPYEPEALWWGLWPIRSLPTHLFTVAASATLALILYLWWRELRHGTLPLSTLSVSEIPTNFGWYAVLAISALLFIAFFAFPIAHTRWGDAYIISRTLAWPTEEFRLTHTWQAPLDVFLHSRVWLLMRSIAGWEEARPVYRLLSPLAGAVYLIALLGISRKQRYAPMWLTYGLLATLGLLQLFFGYIENYSFTAAMTMVYLYCGVMNLQREWRLWPAALALGLANAFHPSTLVLLPSLLVLAWYNLPVDSEQKLGMRARAGGNLHLRSIVVQIVLPLSLTYGLTWAMMELGDHGLRMLLTSDRPGGGDASWFVPLRATTTEWERYTLFSWPHLRDIVNEQLLVAPVVLPSLVVMTVASLWRPDIATTSVGRSASDRILSPNRPVLLFTFIAAMCYLALTWVWNPDYGGQRDWDLFSLAAIPTTLLLVYALSRALGTKRYLVLGAVPLIAVQGLHTAAWVYHNTQPWNWP